MVNKVMTNSEKVYEIVESIPRGKVLTYGILAELVGITNPRVVGNILHSNPYEDSVHCHRVVNAQGGLAPAFAFGGAEKQKEKLLKEGATFRGEFVILEKCLWDVDAV